MKAYTNIEQSKKLAEILPLESTDMRYTPFGDTHPWFLSNDLIEKDSTPCWSLAALFSVLPEYIKFDGHTWKIYNDHYGVYYMNADTCDTNTFSTNSENLVDACYEMIIKLHEQKLL